MYECQLCGDILSEEDTYIHALNCIAPRDFKGYQFVEVHGYEWALARLRELDRSPLKWGEDQVEMFEQCEQALKDCIELNLVGG